LLDTSAIQLTSQADDDIGDAVPDGNALSSSQATAGQGDVSLFDGDPPVGSVAIDAVGVDNFTAVTLVDDVSGVIVLQGTNDLDDDATNANTSASNGTTTAQSDASYFNGNLFIGSSEADPTGVWDFAPVTLANSAYSFATTPPTDGLGNSGAASAAVVVPVDAAVQSPPTVNPIPAITIANGATAEIDGASAQSVTFAGSTGILVLNDALAFTGQISGLAGIDAIASYVFGQHHGWHTHHHERDRDGKHHPYGRLSVVKLDANQRWQRRHYCR
jgi:large repetitive protein